MIKSHESASNGLIEDADLEDVTEGSGTLRLQQNPDSNEPALHEVPNTSTSGNDSGEQDTVLRLLDRALDDIGSGPFQQKLLAIICSAFFLDATTEPVILALLFPAIESEWRGDDSDLAMIVGFNELGKMFGALCFGVISDHFGRKTSFTASLILCSFFGFMSSFTNSYYGFALLRFFVGLGYGGNMVASNVLLVEYLPSNKRSLYVSVGTVVYALGLVFVTLLCWGALRLIGFRWIIRLAALLGVPVIIALSRVPESARFLISKGNYEKATEYLRKVAQDNKQEVPRYFTVSELTKVDHPAKCIEKHIISDVGGHIKVKKCCTCDRNHNCYDCHACKNCYDSACGDFKLISKLHILKTLIPLGLIWFLNNFAFSVNIWAPLQIDKIYSNVSNTEKGIEFEVGIVLASGWVAGSLIAILTSVFIKRLWALRIGTLFCSLSVLLIGVVDTRPVMYFLLILLAISASVTLNGLFLYTPEVFPTSIRVTAFGICQFVHRLAPVLAPFAMAAVDDISFDAVCYMMGGCYFVAFCLIFALQIETFNAPFAEENENKYPSGNQRNGQTHFQTLYDNEDALQAI